MQVAKDEMKKVKTSLNKLIVKKESFKNIFHMVPNRISLAPGEPVYLKL